MPTKRLKRLAEVNQFTMAYKDKLPEEVVEFLNKEMPISLKYNEDLVDRICLKYPYLPKSEVAVIVRGVFQSLRDILLLGNKISIAGLVFHLKLSFVNLKSNKYRLRPYFVTPRSLE